MVSEHRADLPEQGLPTSLLSDLMSQIRCDAVLFEGLDSARQQNWLLDLLAAGHANTQIAWRLGLSEGTVRTHLENIYRRLQVSSRTAAVTRAFQDRDSCLGPPTGPYTRPG
jgi:DNA-binding NarL/FixJ family response regulator